MYNVDCFFDIKHTFFKNQISQSCDKRKCRLYGCKRKRHRLAEDKVRRLTEAQLQKPSSLRFPHCFKSRPTRSVTRVAFGRERGENKCQGVVFAFQKKRKRAKMPFSPVVRITGLEPAPFRTGT